MESKLTFVELLNDALHVKNMRKADLAKRLEIGKSTITKWCNGLTKPQFFQLPKLVLILDIDFKHYFSFSLEKIPMKKSNAVLEALDEMEEETQLTTLSICKVINRNKIV